MPPPAPSVVPLWPAQAVPGALGAAETDTPTLTLFLPENAGAPTPALIVCPGGGYNHLAFEHEGLFNAQWFRARGVAAFVLKYRLPVDGYRHPVPLQDAQRAVRLVRSRAAEWGVNPGRVGAMGFSAGGHLVSTLETHFDAGNPQASDPVDRLGCRPDFAVLVYPVITLTGPNAHAGSRTALLGKEPDPIVLESLCNHTQVTPRTPPTLLVHSVDDPSVPIANSEMMLAALQKANVPAALHAYPTGRHGFGYGSPDPENKRPPGWLDAVQAWLQQESLI
jgi:acetyl esterase/lipase